YCMPEAMTFRPRAELMQDDELKLLMRVFTGLGFHKFRLTGGEPTVRANIVEIVRSMAQTPGVRTLTMTTNGVLLRQLAAPLKEAGLQRVNVSIDTLDPARFRRITRWGSLDDVWDGLLEAERVGLTPLKLNAVVVRGYNENDVADLAALTLQHPWQVRFISMKRTCQGCWPRSRFGEVAGFQQAQIVTEQEMRARIEARLGPLHPVNDGQLDGEARLYRLSRALGDVGFISSVTVPFCASCTRARLTADGKLRMCLLREYEVDLLTPLRRGAPVEDLAALVKKAVYHKPWGHGLAQNLVPMNRVMSEIGG
ncbi:MAG: GTP 3',8-cyclase MoaA, partial [Anaerolineales bacterium]|nr:GTP 3',8-cyclase MoaA [Anaerolineales bacterium]